MYFSKLLLVQAKKHEFQVGQLLTRPQIELMASSAEWKIFS